MSNKPQKEEIDFEALINNMSSINSEDYWFKKISQFEEHDEHVYNAEKLNDQDKLQSH